MTPDLLFQIASAAVLPAWLGLVFRPDAAWAHRVAAGTAMALALLYAAALSTALATGAAGGFGSLGEVGALFAHPWALLAGWVHYLAFDLLVGSWEARDAAERRVPRWALAPCLALTFLLGPVGWALYLAARRWLRRDA
jgi:hypothetical protein